MDDDPLFETAARIDYQSDGVGCFFQFEGVPGGHRRSDSGGVTMTDSTRKEILVAWQLRKQEEILHPFLNERIPFGLVPHAQALLLARYLRGDLDAYPSFLWK